MIDLANHVYDEDLTGIIEDGTISDYCLHEGLLEIPIMGPVGTPPVVVRTHAPYTTRKVDFRMTRNKMPPVIPVPGDTPSKGSAIGGDIYLGGDIKLSSPRKDSEGYLIYSVAGTYNFVSPVDAREHGKLRFDARSFLSEVDFLGYYNINPKKIAANDIGDVWQLPYFDLNLLASARILG